MRPTPTTEIQDLTASDAEARVRAILRIPRAELMIERGQDMPLELRPMLRARPGTTRVMWFATMVTPHQRAELEAISEGSIWLRREQELTVVTGEILCTSERSVIEAAWDSRWGCWFTGASDPLLAVVAVRGRCGTYWDLADPLAPSVDVDFGRGPP